MLGSCRSLGKATGVRKPGVSRNGSKGSSSSRRDSSARNYSSFAENTSLEIGPAVGARPIPATTAQLVDHSTKLSDRQSSLLKLSMTEVRLHWRENQCFVPVQLILTLFCSTERRKIEKR